MTLTEQWKKGKLPIGRYYIKDINDEICVDYYVNNGFINGFEDFVDDEIKEVLAHVPSYEKYSRLNHLENDFIKAHERINKLEKENQQLKEEKAQLIKFLEEFNALDVAKENQQLKELLKECDNELKILRMLSLPMASKGALSECDDLLSKIDNAIGEKK